MKTNILFIVIAVLLFGCEKPKRGNSDPGIIDPGTEEPVIPELALDKVSIITSAEQNTLSVEITCNTDWTATSDHDWLKLSPADGVKNGTLTITVDANTTDATRESVIEVVAGIDENRKKETVTIVQILAVTAPTDAKTENVWIVGEVRGEMQLWSDAISLPRCDKTDFNGRMLETGDCRNNPGYGYLYSWNFVDKNGDELCPDGWQVPSTDDFGALFDILGSDVATYTSADIWGAEWGGACNNIGGLGQQEGSGEVAAHYWSSTDYGNPLAYYFSLYASGSVFPQTMYSYDLGFQVRCMRWL